MEKITKKVVFEERTKPIRVAIFSNGPELPTGYAKVIREIAVRLRKDSRFDVMFWNENYNGGPTNWNGIPVVACWANPPDKIVNVFVERMKETQPDVILILEDSFTLKNFGFEQLMRIPPKRIMYMPLDGDWIPTTGINVLRSMDKIVSMAKFTQDVLTKESFDSDLIYHGVDLELFSPITKEKKNEFRKASGFAEDDFIIFNYGRNSLRKSNQALLHIAATYLKTAPKNHKFLIHIMQKEDEHLNLADYMQRHLKLEFDEETLSRIYFTDFNLERPANDQQVAMMIQMSDLAVSASTGEGFGLIMAEAMACAVPIVHTDYTTPKELLLDTSMGIGERGWGVKPAALNISSFNTEHAFVDQEEFVKTLHTVASNPEEMKRRGLNGRQFAEQYLNWDYIVEQWKEVIQKIV